MHLFIYFLHFRSAFFFFAAGAEGVGGTHGEPVVVRFWHTCVIHVQTLWLSQSIFMLLKKTGCVHGSILSPIMFPPYSNRRRGDLITAA